MSLSEMYELKWWLTYSIILEGRFHPNFSPFDITLNLSLVSWTSVSEDESDIEALDNESDDEDAFPFSP